MRRYSSLTIAIHWLTALFVLAAWFTAEGGPNVRSNPPLLHFTLGLAVLLLVVPRLLARWMGATPRGEDPQSRWLELAARLGHSVLYLLLIALPLSGWYAASHLGIPVSFLGIGVPSLTAPVQGAPGLIAELHENGGTVILILAGLHALIALWHQFILRDGVLGRMIPVSALTHQHGRQQILPR
jgi:cytochrome b561